MLLLVILQNKKLTKVFLGTSIGDAQKYKMLWVYCFEYGSRFPLHENLGLLSFAGKIIKIHLGRMMHHKQNSFKRNEKALKNFYV